MRTSPVGPPAGRMVRGTLRRRLLVNAVVDPDEAASRLPLGLRPHVTPLGTVVGCCLLDIEQLRPRPLPAPAGIRMRAAAHRISAEWEDERGDTVVGVFVPGRCTDSRLAVALGGRWFPGVHRPARVVIRETDTGLSWRVEGDGEFDIAVAVTTTASHPLGSAGCDPVGGTCLAATIGLSPDRTGALEGARMAPERRDAREAIVEELSSSFISAFTTAQPAPAYLMEDIAVTWTAGDGPSIASVVTSK